MAKEKVNAAEVKLAAVKEKPAKAADKKPKKEKKKRDNLIKGMVSELKKVTWPTKKELTSYSISVLIFVALMSVAIYLMDLLSSFVIQLLTDTLPGLF